jgi:hypothetical protein
MSSMGREETELVHWFVALEGQLEALPEDKSQHDLLAGLRSRCFEHDDFPLLFTLAQTRPAGEAAFAAPATPCGPPIGWAAEDATIAPGIFLLPANRSVRMKLQHIGKRRIGSLENHARQTAS